MVWSLRPWKHAKHRMILCPGPTEEGRNIYGVQYRYLLYCSCRIRMSNCSFL